MAHPVDWMTEIDDYDVLRLAHVMQATRTSNAEMAEKLGVTDRTIRNWLSGHSRPRDAAREAIQDYLRKVKNRAYSTVVHEVEPD